MPTYHVRNLEGSFETSFTARGNKHAINIVQDMLLERGSLEYHKHTDTTCRVLILDRHVGRKTGITDEWVCDVAETVSSGDLT